MERYFLNPVADKHNAMMAGDKKRGRPRQFNPDEALEAMRRVFAMRGFSDASLDDLTAACGLNRPSIYAAFGDKETLYLKSLHAYGVQLTALLEQALSETGSLEQKLTSFMTAYAQRCSDGEIPHGCMILGAIAGAHHPALAKAARHLRGMLCSAFETYFRGCVQRNELPEDPSPALRAQLTIALTDTIGNRARLGEAAKSLEAFAHDSLALICKI